MEAFLPVVVQKICYVHIWSVMKDLVGYQGLIHAPTVPQPYTIKMARKFNNAVSEGKDGVGGLKM